MQQPESENGMAVKKRKPSQTKCVHTECFTLMRPNSPKRIEGASAASFADYLIVAPPPYPY